MSLAPITDILRRELDGMQRLGVVLAEEFAALGRTEPDAVDAVLRRKSAVLKDLQHCAGERAAVLAAAGLADAADIEAWLRTSSGEPAAALWRDLLSRTREVWTQLQTNSALLEGLLRYNRQSLDLLTRLADPGATYQADGSTAGGFGTRSRGQA